MRNVKYPERNERLRQFQKAQGITVKELGQQIGFSINYASQLVAGHTTITANKAYQILQAFPQLSMDWLMNGAGEMLLQQQQAPALSPEPKMAIEDLPGIIQELQSTVKKLEARLTEIENRI